VSTAEAAAVVEVVERLNLSFARSGMLKGAVRDGVICDSVMLFEAWLRALRKL
jgi:hypothetical protein